MLIPKPVTLFSLILCSIPQASAQENEPAKRAPVKIVGDETSLVKVKAEPVAYLDRPVILTGVIKVDDYYNDGYFHAKQSHYAFLFRQVTPELELGETCQLYLNRSIGRQIMERLLAENEKGRDLVRMRVKAILVKDRYYADDGLTWNMLELTDVQFATEEGDDWEPWVRRSKEEAEIAARDREVQIEEEAKAALAKERQAKAAAEKAARTRTWKDQSGKFSVVAEFGGFVKDAVVLKKNDGKRIKVPVAKLSAEDQAWLTELKAKRAAKK